MTKDVLLRAIIFILLTIVIFFIWLFQFSEYLRSGCFSFIDVDKACGLWGGIAALFELFVMYIVLLYPLWIALGMPRLSHLRNKDNSKDSGGAE